MIAKRADANQPEVTEALRKIGAVVTPIHTVGKGVSDLLVSYDQTWFVLEVKDGRKPKSAQKLTKDEVTWQGKQRAPVYTVASAEEAIFVVKNRVACTWKA